MVVSDTKRAIADLLAGDVDAGVALALDVLAGEPRIKPSRGLLIDPGDAARQAWERRVGAAIALLESAAAVRVFDEIVGELRDAPELAHDVLRDAEPHCDLTDPQRADLLALR